ncbi:hypothetical protein BT96DRAFT_1010950 [Gymnopus androsaceus JB14]|uniref:Uncharacterized protein n=1 Tax=Gymnopus androsaceus JB14 TaxID=1447944 RepID=A0A6A4G9Z5_9AGAR|nr:hypothetical protein BT96DRAFT_1010950 [Gymnopus androsaceus JB14]
MAVEGARNNTFHEALLIIAISLIPSSNAHDFVPEPLRCQGKCIASDVLIPPGLYPHPETSTTFTRPKHQE